MPVVPSTTAHDFWEWIDEQSGNGSMSYKLDRVLKSEGFSGGPTNSTIFAWLRSLGYTGTLTNMINKFERDNTVQHG